MSDSAQLTAGDGHFAFHWSLADDQARLLAESERAVVWTGSLLPLLWLVDARGEFHAVKAAFDPAGSQLTEARVELALRFGAFGHGRLRVSLDAATVRFAQLELTWAVTPPALHSLYFGCNVLTPAQRRAAPTLDLPFWPDWRSEGYGVISAKTNPMQSFFRSWDFGHTNLPLGSFGPAMGTPYVAAFPRPIYAAGLGGRHGWLCLGAGAVPDASLTLQVRARSGALEWRYREDLWDARTETTRRWENPLWLAWAPTAWAAYRTYFRLFDPAPARPPAPQKSFGGTWGDFRLSQFDLKASAERAGPEFGADLLCIDDPWESTKGSCTPNRKLLPNFEADLAHARTKGLGVGIWMPMGWLEDPASAGLTNDDLLLGRDGVPVTGNWAVDPHEPGMAYCCPDPASERARQFLRDRTARVIRDYHPTLLKLDFGYGLPGPDAAMSRDPAYRGERLAWSYMKIIAEAAHALDPAITILGYSVHPLWDAVQDQCSLDDLGDAGVHEAAAHGQWSIWVSLLGERGKAILGSSGYHWSADTEVILNSAIIGAPGVNLPRVLADGSPVPPAQIARRRGLFRWFRRTTRWEPLWLDTATGSLEQEPTPRNWGRLEPIAGRPALTALALRAPSSLAQQDPALRGLRWTGTWALLAQDDASIFAAPRTAVIAFTAGTIALPRDRAPKSITAVFTTHEAPHENWAWADGQIRLTVDEATVNQPLLGFLIAD